MLRCTALSSLQLAALSLLPIAGVAAHAEAVRRPALLAQAAAPPQVEQVVPEDDDKDRKGKRDRKRGRENATPAPTANVPADSEQKGPPPQGRKEKPEKSGRDAVNPTQGPPPAVGENKRRDRGDDGPPRQEPSKAEAPAAPPTERSQEKRRQKQVEPRETEQPQMQPEKAAAPPAKEQPKSQPAETKQQPPATKSQETKGPPPTRAQPERNVGSDGNMDEVKKRRRQRTEDGGKRTVIEEPGNRVIVKEGGQTTIRHDETERLRRSSRAVRREKRRDGTTVTIAVRPGGIEIYSVFDDDGRLQRRYRRGKDGREVTLIDNRRGRGYGDRGYRRRGGLAFYVDLRPPRIGIPRNRYVVEYDNASEDDVYDALIAPPVEDLERGYTLDEIRYNRNLRDRMRRIDLDTVNFAFGSWSVAPSQYDKLSRVARAINRILDRRSDEMFIVEGHTDAVGDDIDNLTLSDRRAEEVAYILTESFNVPPENLVTQGYGEDYLKINTQRPERANRRVAVRRITPLLARRN